MGYDKVGECAFQILIWIYYEYTFDRMAAIMRNFSFVQSDKKM
jgi:hypothetical protein